MNFQQEIYKWIVYTHSHEYWVQSIQDIHFLWKIYFPNVECPSFSISSDSFPISLHDSFQIHILSSYPLYIFDGPHIMIQSWKIIFPEQPTILHVDPIHIEPLRPIPPLEMEKQTQPTFLSGTFWKRLQQLPWYCSKFVHAWMNRENCYFSNPMHGNLDAYRRKMVEVVNVHKFSWLISSTKEKDQDETTFSTWTIQWEPFLTMYDYERVMRELENGQIPLHHYRWITKWYDLDASKEEKKDWLRTLQSYDKTDEDSTLTFLILLQSKIQKEYQIAQNYLWSIQAKLASYRTSLFEEELIERTWDPSIERNCWRIESELFQD